MKYKDYYQTLGVSRDATQDAIKQAYRRLARKYHPDVSKEANAEMRFKEVAEAYEVLKDAEKRSAYDQFGDQWKAGQDFTPPPNWHAGFEFGGGGFSSARGFSDFFESLFGQAFGSSSVRHGGGVQSQGCDQHAKIVVSLEDAYHGVTRAITLQTSDRDSNGHVLTRPHTLNVKIPKGVMEGQRIRLAGQGAPGINGERRGDLYLEIAYHPHRLFRVEKRDIHIELPITPWEAGLGRAVKVPTLAGNVELKIPPGSQTGQKLRLRNRGLPGKPAGDQFVELKIVTPKPKTDSHRAIYEKMAREMPMNPRVDLEV